MVLENKKSNKEDEIVFVKKGDVFTNSYIISCGAKVSHKKILGTISNHKDKLNELGNKLTARHQVINNKKETIYDLNEQQSTFLITLLKNTESVIQFKMELVQKFFAWREELRKRKEIMPQFQIERRNLTDAIKDLPESPHKHMKYIHYTNLVYQAVTGYTAKKLKEIRQCAKNASPYDFLSSEELEAVTRLEIKIAVLIDSGLSFSEIKDIVYNKFKDKLISKSGC